MSNKSNQVKSLINIIVGIGFFGLWRYAINESENGGYDDYFNLSFYFICFFSPSIFFFIIGLQFLVKKEKKCDKCKGTGKIYPTKTIDCYDCDGTGKRVLNTWVNKNGENVKVFELDGEGYEKECNSCYGSGCFYTDDYSKEKEDCWSCKGRGYE